MAVPLHYTGTLKDGSVFDSSKNEGREPFTFQLGSGTVIPGFDEGVLGMSVGEQKTINIPVESAYGPKQPHLILDVPLNALPAGVTEGAQLYGQGPEGPIAATVVSIQTESNTAVLDHNHPLAGQDLTFELELLDVN